MTVHSTQMTNTMSSVFNKFRVVADLSCLMEDGVTVPVRVDHPQFTSYAVVLSEPNGVHG